MQTSSFYKYNMNLKYKSGVTNKSYKFNFQKLNLNIFEVAWGSYPSQKIEKLLLLNKLGK